MDTAQIDSIFRQDELRKARTKVYQGELRTVSYSSRKSADPAERVALAELEKRLRQTYAELETNGLVDPMPEGMVA